MQTLGLVSVIMPVYRGELFVAAAIESVLAQTFQSFELVIINDGTPDDSAREIARFLPHPKIRYVEQNNAGVAGARNAGLDHATGALIALLDQDDVWLPHKLERQVAYLNAHPELGFVHSRVDCIDGAGEVCSCEGAIWVYPFEGFCAGELLLGNGIAPLTVLMRRQCVDEVGPFDQRLAPADDWDLWIRIAERYPVGFIDEVTARYRVHDQNTSKDRLKMQHAVLKIMDGVAAHLPEIARSVSTGQLAAARSLALSRAAEALEGSGRSREARGYWKEAFQVGGNIEAFLAILGVPPRHRNGVERFLARTPRFRRLVRWYLYKASRMFTRNFPTNERSH